MNNELLNNPDETIKMPLVKRLFDIIFACIIFIPFMPIAILIILLNSIEGALLPDARGPIFYKEMRISQGKPFVLRKFRIFKKKILEKTLQEKGFIHTKPLEQDDNNLTITGKLLKKFYLDELPQIFSILSGKMSFVGPRPWNPVDYQNEIKQGIYRKKVIKAGLTGLVQISKGQNNKQKKDIDLDNQYILFCKNNSSWKILLFDIKIILKSINLLIKAQGL